MRDSAEDAGHGLQQALPGGLPLLLGITTGVQAQATLTVLALATVAPAAATALDLPAGLIGYQVSLIYLAAALTSCFAGSCVRRWGAGLVTQAALMLGVVGCLGLAMGSPAGAAAASLLLGIGYGLTNPAASHLLHRYTPPHRRNIVFSLKQSGVPIGGIVAGLMLPALAEGLGWQVSILGAAVIGCTLMALVQPLRRSWDEDRRPDTRLRGSLLAGPRLVWRHETLRALAIMGFCFSATQLSLMAFAVTMLVEDLGWALVAAGGAASVMQACGAAARVGWGALADRIGDGRTVLISLGIASTGLATLTASTDPSWPSAATIGLLVAFGACSIGWNGVFLAEVARATPPEAVSSATGGALVFTFFGVVIGPSLFSLLHGTLGSYAATFGVMAAFPAAGTIALLLAWRAGRRRA